MQSETADLTYDVRRELTFDGQILLSELAHRTANDLAVACAEVHIAGRNVAPGHSRDRLAMTVHRLQSLAAIQRLLLPPRSAEIDLAGSLFELCQHQAHARFAEQGAFVRCRVADARITAKRGWPLLVIVSELMTNTARHAFGVPGGLVDVDLSHDAGDLVCIVRDNGVGLRTARKSRGMGTAIIQELARTADVQMTRHDTETGCAIELRVPAERS